MLQNLTGWHFLIILVIILLLFGAPKLPALARSLGQSMKILKTEVASDKKPEEPTTVINADGSTTVTNPDGTTTTTTVRPADAGSAGSTGPAAKN
ncbi:twin-arginine translocase TatA/TatE family subunit [Leifsonia flava]|uniref:Sec-independent protein translocase protein TatA n=1 Tax=Orlajensenia leifsoniae TaxID=2561933 RepID=A0A4Y9R634_9MICO|nr:twin-arginine translocase TatA/TatE family subunit [Leifsonia flava]TFV99133.1 twin-arginine translocase TatA/TatE family subunit [Leifsonia flava]